MIHRYTSCCILHAFIETFEFDPALEQLALNRFQTNVLTYICGWVVRKVSSMLKCSGCRKALVKVPDNLNADFILLRLKKTMEVSYYRPIDCKFKNASLKMQANIFSEKSKIEA